MNIRPSNLLIGSFLALAGLVGSLASAQTKVIKEVNAHSIPSFKGQDLYHEYCAACHGQDGKGSGPAASALKVQPTDLTTLSRRNNNKFPVLALQAYIKGDREVAAHGTLDMPMWGDIFRSISSSRTTAEMRVNSLIDYLQQIQR